MKTLCVTITAALTLFAASVSTARADFVVGGYYHLGESDSGAANGVTGNATTEDSSGLNLDLTLVGSSTYRASVGAGNATTGSTLSADLGTAGGNYYWRNSELTTDVDDWGLEGWFKVSDTSQQALAYNGNSWRDGFGLYIIAGKVQGLYGAVALFDTGFAPTPNEWFYAAIVRNSGVTKMYVNGTTAINFGSVTAPNNLPVSPQFSIGVAGSTVQGWSDTLKGSADEVRLFAFTPGGFNESQLLYSVPEPSALVLTALGSLGLLCYAWRNRK